MNYLFRRTSAYLIDCLICFGAVMLLIQYLILRPIREHFGITEEWFMDSIHTELYVLTTISLPVWIYFSLFDSSLSKGTPGKRFMSLQVRNISGGQISIGRSFARTIIKLLPWEIAHAGVIFPDPLYFQEIPEIRLVTYAGIALFATYAGSIAADNEHRSVYDRLLGTEVTENSQIIEKA